jgi:Rne/Rng family ribonuclease
MHGPDAVQRMLSDQAAHPVTRIQISTMDHFQLAEEWCSVFAPDLMTKIEPLEMENAAKDFALFDHHDIIPQIEGLFQPYAVLPGGAVIIIQETAALTAVDVNRGADKRSNLEINLDCAVEIARQLVLRNMGGAVVIDFMKMNGKADQQKVIDALEGWFLANDPCTVQVHGVTGLGMVELARQRRTPPLMDRYESTVGG